MTWYMTWPYPGRQSKVIHRKSSIESHWGPSTESRPSKVIYRKSSIKSHPSKIIQRGSPIELVSSIFLTGEGHRGYWIQGPQCSSIVTTLVVTLLAPVIVAKVAQTLLPVFWRISVFLSLGHQLTEESPSEPAHVRGNAVSSSPSELSSRRSRLSRSVSKSARNVGTCGYLVDNGDPAYKCERRVIGPLLPRHWPLSRLTRPSYPALICVVPSLGLDQSLKLVRKDWNKIESF